MGPAAVSLAATPPAIDRDARRALVEGSTHLEGIDFVEVVSNHVGNPGHVAGAPSQRTLLVHLLNGTDLGGATAGVPEDWRAERVRITGGVRADPRVNPVGVEWAYPALAVAGADGVPPTPVLLGPADRRLIDEALPPAREIRARVLVVRTTTSGDWSTYVLHLVGDDGTGAPDGFDPPLARAPFGFTVDCVTGLDCASPVADLPAAGASPVLDYLARDAEALRTRLLDRLSALVPGWADRNAADPAVMLAELFAYLGDRLAYWQDAVAVEAYLGTARRRTSVRRHARILDHRLHEGCSARVLLALTTDTAVTLPAGAAVCDTPPDGDLLPVDADESGSLVVETCHDLALLPDRNAIPLHAWGDAEHTLPAGATAAYLAVPGGAAPRLAAGDLLVLADCPAGRPGDSAVGDPARRFAVRLDRDPVRHVDDLAAAVTVLEVHWHAEDALPAPLTVAEPSPDGTGSVRAVALANVAVADHGASLTWELLDPPRPDADGPYRPRPARTGLAFAEPFDLRAAATRAASRLTAPDPGTALAQITVDDGQRLWHPRPDLLGSSRLDPHLVAEPESDGVARLRFGDGVTGRAPSRQATYTARYRLGGGTRGNVGAGRLQHWLLRADGSPGAVSGSQLSVWNPLPGSGGNDPENLDAVRQLAPAVLQGSRGQLRAVTSSDYALSAQEVSGVQRSVARRRWTGSWYAQEVTVDALAARVEDRAVPLAVSALLETRRMAGVDVAVARPVYVALGLELFGCLAPGYLVADVERQLVDALSSRLLPGASTGFFHPDRFTFAQPLQLSDLVAAAMAVPGLAWVEVRRFARLGAPGAATRVNLAAGRISAGPREVLRCDSDPNNPEAGRLTVVLGGGS